MQDFGMTALQALAYPRLHDQIFPQMTFLEMSQPEIGFVGYSEHDRQSLEDRGHNTTFVPTGFSIACGVKWTETDGWEAAGDPRRFDSGGAVSN
jgi:gamma-glutamyltranspeptidase/glutathione hydrolase